MRSFLAKLTTVKSSDLTSREEVIVDYIKRNSKLIVDENIKIDELAKKVKTGFSAIYGLLKKLEIDGYRDFMICLANDVEHDELSVLQNDEEVSNLYINIIKQNHTLIKKDNLIKSVELIKSSSRVFVCYWEGILKGPAMDLNNFLYKQNLNSFLLDSDWDSINERIKICNENDIFIFITKTGSSTHLEKVVEYVNSKKAKSIFVSGKLPSKIIKSNSKINHTLIVEGQEFENEGLTISKNLPFHYFNDLLIYHFLNFKNR